MRPPWCWCWCLLLAALCHCTTDDNQTEPFVPTNQWQVVKKGQAVPDGLHISMNLETRIIKAKLMDSDEKSEKSLTVINTDEQTNESNPNKSPNLLSSAPEEALKNLASSKSKPARAKRFKTLAELKSEFSELRMEAKSDMEIMHELLRRYENLIKEHPLSLHREKLSDEIIDTPSSLEMLAILTDIEYLVHQFDNAAEFIRLNGLENIIYPHLNASDNTLKAEALKLLGSCLQNHIKVQIHALDTNAGEKLLKILSLDNNEYVKARAIHALSCLVRGFPLAQKQIITKHGMDVFHKILLSNNPSYFKLKIPIIVLLDDLVLEHKLILEFHVHGKTEDEDKLRQYYEVDLMSKLSNPIFCDILTKLLEEYFEYDNTDIDSLDKITSAIKTFGHICKHHHYKDKRMLMTLHKIQSVYGKLLKSAKKSDEVEGSGEDMEYFSNILDFVDNYLSVLNDAKLRDEL
ncbi:sil1 nucleotide exchange factor [Arctopsyche grandis]|uniref:sil1 nucleotide exchange factor n=1 Tax=Arctopsyche grandis TaxID=121162 RepID=UPI00406D9A7D